MLADPLALTITRILTLEPCTSEARERELLDLPSLDIVHRAASQIQSALRGIGPVRCLMPICGRASWNALREGMVSAQSEIRGVI